MRQEFKTYRYQAKLQPWIESIELPEQPYKQQKAVGHPATVNATAKQ